MLKGILKKEKPKNNSLNEEEKKAPNYIGVLGLFRKKRFLLFFLLIPVLVSIIGGILGVFLIENGIYFSSEDGFDSIETYILLSGYLICAAYAFFAAKFLPDPNSNIIFNRSRTIVFAAGFSFFISYMSGYVVGSSVFRGIDPAYDPDLPAYAMVSDTLAFVAMPSLITLIFGGFFLIYLIFSHYYEFPKVAIEPEIPSMVSVESPSSVTVIQDETPRFSGAIRSKISQGVQSDKNKTLVSIYVLACIGLFLYTLSPDQPLTQEYDLLIILITVSIMPLFFFALFVGIIFVIIEGLIYTIGKVRNVLLPDLTMLNFFLNRAIKNTEKNNEVDLELLEDHGLILKSQEFILWFGLFLYSAGLGIYSIFESLGSTSDQLQLIVTSIIGVFIFILPLIIPFLEPQMLLFSSGLFVKQRRTGELRRVGWIRIISKSSFLKVGGFITGFFYVLTRVSTGLLELLFVNIDQVGYIIFFVSIVLFAGWLIFWKYEHNSEFKLKALNDMLSKKGVQ